MKKLIRFIKTLIKMVDRYRDWEDEFTLPRRVHAVVRYKNGSFIDIVTQFSSEDEFRIPAYILAPGAPVIGIVTDTSFSGAQELTQVRCIRSYQGLVQGQYLVIYEEM